MAGPSTEKFYARGARQFLLAAGSDGSLARRVERFRECHLQPIHKLTRNTCGVYRQFLARSCAHFLQEGADRDQIDALHLELRTALDDRIGEPDVDRTSRLKTEVPDFADVAATFALLRDRAIKRAHRKSGAGQDEPEIKDWLEVLLILYLVCVPRLGMRPIELLNARRQGNNVMVSTAKRAGNPIRSIPLLGWSNADIAALDLLLLLVPKGLDFEGYVRWRNALASRLARASSRACNERLALYFGRHVAIARWRELGLTMEQIRILAGHVGYRSQAGYGFGAGGKIVKWISTAERVAAARYIAEAEQRLEKNTMALEFESLVAGTDDLFDRAKPAAKPEPDADGERARVAYFKELDKKLEGLENIEIPSKGTQYRWPP